MKNEESNPTGMTLDELEAFVVQARRLEYPGDTRVRTVAKINGKMFKISVDTKDSPTAQSAKERK